MALSASQNIPSAQLALPIVPKAISLPFLESCTPGYYNNEGQIREETAFDGFYFGRYDVRVPSEEDLRRGRAFKVIELNGATSEATHIYDPRYGVLAAWRTLFRQWRLLFEIAAANHARGAPTVRWTELLRLMTHYRAAARSHPT